MGGTQGEGSAKPERCHRLIFPNGATNPQRPGSYDLIPYAPGAANCFEERRLSHVSDSGCCAGSALAWRVLRPAREQLPHSPAAPLRPDLHHHELRRRQTSSLTNLEEIAVQNKGRT